jgi:hypothetical protein
MRTRFTLPASSGRSAVCAGCVMSMLLVNRKILAVIPQKPYNIMKTEVRLTGCSCTLQNYVDGDYVEEDPWHSFLSEAGSTTGP